MASETPRLTAVINPKIIPVAIVKPAKRLTDKPATSPNFSSSEDTLAVDLAVLSNCLFKEDCALTVFWAADAEVLVAVVRVDNPLLAMVALPPIDFNVLSIVNSLLFKASKLESIPFGIFILTEPFIFCKLALSLSTTGLIPNGPAALILAVRLNAVAIFPYP